MPKAKVLIVDDEPEICKLFSKVLSKEGYEVLTAGRGTEAIEKVQKEEPKVVLLDIKMPGMDGMETLRRLKETSQETSVIIVTAHGSMDSAVEAIKLGAYDYVTKPFDIEKIKILIKRALHTYELSKKVNYLTLELEEKHKLENIVGKDPKMYEVYKTIGKVVNSKVTVLIRGESGTGKELVAHAIHYNSLLKNKPFVAVDCASLPQTLLESELFGHEKGSFTGAIARKLGKFELANEGTLFLDEIGNLTLETQAKLLRVLQEKKFVRVGGAEPIDVDVRIIAATHQDLEKAVREGMFREDLYYRLNVVLIYLPALRERRDDIPLLTDHFLRKFKEESGGKVKNILPETMEFLEKYEWPGNVRELENVIERAIVTGKSSNILPEDLPPRVQMVSSEPSLINIPGRNVSFEEAVANFEKQLILKALRESNWVQTKAAKSLDLTRRILKYKMGKYGIKKEE
jgi:DNA-binding NtrC family response regulator